MEREWTKAEDELVTQFNGGGGWTLPVFGDLSAFTLLQGKLEYTRALTKSSMSLRASAQAYYFSTESAPCLSRPSIINSPIKSNVASYTLAISYL